jgi:hypothetical protein
MLLKCLQNACNKYIIKIYIISKISNSKNIYLFLFFLNPLWDNKFKSYINKYFIMT